MVVMVVVIACMYEFVYAFLGNYGKEVVRGGDNE